MSGRERLATLGLLVAAAAQYAWNAWSLPPLAGYDAAGHLGYALAIAREARIPAPLSGWSTFHPPAWYLAAAVLWRAGEPLGPEALRLALRALGGGLWLAAGLRLHGALRRQLGARAATAWVALALWCWVPVNQLAAAMLGNESFAAAWAALAVPALLRLEADPRDRRAALAAGLAAGLACATKFTGAWVAVACAVPFARHELGRDGRRALALCALSGLAVAGPVYARNLALTGELFPMTRERLAIMRAAEASLTLGPRRLSDYVRVPLDCGLRPSVHQVRGRPGAWSQRNASMQSVPCLAYAGLWYDPFGQRVPIARHRDGEWAGPLLLALGLAPTAITAAGLFAAAGALAGRRRPAETPLVAMSALALASFAGFTWFAPSLTAAKASYLLPLAAPAAVFFARAADALPPRLRAAGLGGSAAAALAAALVFTNQLGFAPDREHARVEALVWERIGTRLPGSRIAEAVRILAGARPHPSDPPPRAAPRSGG